MKNRWIAVAALVAFFAVVATLSTTRHGLLSTLQPAPPASTTFRDIRWDELSPAGWDPMKRFRDSNRGELDDSDPQSQRLMRAIWDHAPIVDSLDGAAVTLRGYVVPLESAQGALKEFLLVPYFGACLHSPPPPANQIVHVVAAQPAAGIRSMDTVWVSGTLATSRHESSMGMSGYRLQAVAVNTQRTTGGGWGLRTDKPRP